MVHMPKGSSPGRARGVIRTVKFVCSWCGVDVERSLNTLGRGKYCSRACAGAQGRANHVPEPKGIVVCAGCGEPFEKWVAWIRGTHEAALHFHDMDCRRHYYAARATETKEIPSTRKSPRESTRIPVECTICGVIATFTPSRAPSVRYCSLKCKDIGQQRILTGRRNVLVWKSTAFRGLVRKLLVDRCVLCGWDETKNDVCHIVARKDGGDDVIENVVMLCPNHHRLYDSGRIERSEIMAVRHLCTTPASSSSK